MSALLTPECRGPLPSASPAGERPDDLGTQALLAELARVSSHRANLQDQLEATFAARWSR